MKESSSKCSKIFQVLFHSKKCEKIACLNQDYSKETAESIAHPMFETGKSAIQNKSTFPIAVTEDRYT